MSGTEATRQLLDLCAREEFVALDLVARALAVSKRRIWSDWKRKKRPFTAVGREVRLASSLVIEVYFPHRQ